VTRPRRRWPRSSRFRPIKAARSEDAVNAQPGELLRMGGGVEIVPPFQPESEKPAQFRSAKATGGHLL